VPAAVAGSTAMALRYPTPGAGTQLFAAVAAAIVGAIIAAMIDRGKRSAFIANHALARERERSEGLLRNMLPSAIVDRLKTSEGRIAEQLDAVTVMFADIVGFTQLSSEISAAEVVGTLDEIFSAFDALVERHGLEKIKTIGDAYMVVGGAPTPRTDHTEAIAAMALEMRDIVEGRTFAGGRKLQMRIGIHTGPVVAGVIGKKKFVYDLWGDTVNTASRMESHGVPGTVHVSEATYLRLRDGFALSPRGIVEIKGKGAMSTWVLDGRTAGDLRG
jgi:class 3 adenylate cyclase